MNDDPRFANYFDAREWAEILAAARVIVDESKTEEERAEAARSLGCRASWDYDD